MLVDLRIDLRIKVECKGIEVVVVLMKTPGINQQEDFLVEWTVIRKNPQGKKISATCGPQHFVQISHVKVSFECF